MGRSPEARCRFVALHTPYDDIGEGQAFLGTCRGLGITGGLSRWTELSRLTSRRICRNGCPDRAPLTGRAIRWAIMASASSRRMANQG
jgi:hypothetical protein